MFCSFHPLIPKSSPRSGPSLACPSPEAQVGHPPDLWASCLVFPHCYYQQNLLCPRPWQSLSVALNQGFSAGGSFPPPPPPGTLSNSASQDRVGGAPGMEWVRPRMLFNTPLCPGQSHPREQCKTACKECRQKSSSKTSHGSPVPSR